MENSPFDLNEAVRLWRTEFGSLHVLSAEDLEELEHHLRDRTAALQAAGMPMEQAFRAARQRLGLRQEVGAEFAKIHPQRVWLERGCWMMAGLLVFQFLGVLSGAPGDIALNYGMRSHWNPAVMILASELIKLVTLVAAALLCWWCLQQKSGWVRAAAHFSVRSPLFAGFALFLLLRGASLFFHSSIYMRVQDWILPTAQGTSVDPAWVATFEQWGLVGAVAVNVVWAAGLAWYATRVLRTRRWPADSRLTAGQPQPEHVLWLERGLWLVTGAVLARIVTYDVIAFGFLPCLLLQPTSLPVALQHLIGLLGILLEAGLGVASIWVCWRLMTRHPRLSERFKRAFQHGPLLAAVAVAVLLNLNLIVGLLLKWMGIGASGHGIGLVVAHWGDAGWVINSPGDTGRVISRAASSANEVAGRGVSPVD
jgi:hypothetical protein